MIWAFCGKLGHGKSFTQLETVCQLAEKQNRFIVANIPLNPEALERYFWKKKQFRNAAKLRRGWLFFETDFNRIMAYENAVILADELGIFMNSRDSVTRGSGAADRSDAQTRKKFLADLILSRKAGLDLCWVSQDMAMVDANIRRLTNFYVHTINTDPSKRPNKLRRRFLSYFDAPGYEKWNTERTVKSWLRNNLDWKVKAFDLELFGAFDTLHRLNDSPTFPLDQVASELGVGDEVKTSPRILRVPAEYRPGEVAS